MIQLGSFGEQERIPFAPDGEIFTRKSVRKTWLQINARRRTEERRGRWRWGWLWHVVAVTAKRRTHGGEGLAVEKAWVGSHHPRDIPMRTKPGTNPNFFYNFKLKIYRDQVVKRSLEPWSVTTSTHDACALYRLRRAVRSRWNGRGKFGGDDAISMRACASRRRRGLGMRWDGMASAFGRTRTGPVVVAWDRSPRWIQLWAGVLFKSLLVNPVSIKKMSHRIFWNMHGVVNEVYL